MNTTHVLYNPLAAGGAGTSGAMKLKNMLPKQTRVFHNLLELDLPAFLDELDADMPLIICGGDGTLHHFVNDAQGKLTGRKIYYYATGTGNDFLRDIGAQTHGGPVRIDRYLQNLPSVTVKGQSRLFLNGVGYGIDGYCCQEGDRLHAAGETSINYTKIAIEGLLFHYHPTGARITVDGKEYEFKRVWLAPTMFGRFYGGSMMPTPAQNRLAERQQVSVMVFHSFGKLRTLAVFPSIFKGAHIKHRAMVQVLSGEHITVQFDRPTPLQIDGETVLDVTEYTVFARANAAVGAGEKTGSNF